MAEIVTRTPEQVYDHWIAALRSGEFQQAQYTLRYVDRDTDKSKFCCLGVACELAQRDGGPPWDQQRYMGGIGIMPPAMRMYIGMSVEQESKLVALNDTRKLPFSQIADHIEKRIKPVALAIVRARNAAR